MSMVLEAALAELRIRREAIDRAIESLVLLVDPAASAEGMVQGARCGVASVEPAATNPQPIVHSPEPEADPGAEGATAVQKRRGSYRAHRATQEELPKREEAICELLKACGAGMSARDLATALGTSYIQAYNALGRLAGRGAVWHNDEGWFIGPAPENPAKGGTAPAERIDEPVKPSIQSTPAAGGTAFSKAALGCHRPKDGKACSERPNYPQGSWCPSCRARVKPVAGDGRLEGLSSHEGASSLAMGGVRRFS